MPLYDFKCDKCNKIFEKIVKNNSNIIFCDCGSTAKKIFNPTSNFHLKGACWAKDNYTKKRSKDIDL